MGVALLAARRSRTPIPGRACIVSDDNIILSTGYNGLPAGCSDDDTPGRERAQKPNTPMSFMPSSTRFLNSGGRSLRGARLYVALFPCNECAKAIIQSGIREVIYLSDKYADSPATLASKRMFRSAGSKCAACIRPCAA